VRWTPSLLVLSCGLGIPVTPVAGDQVIPFREAWGWAIVVPVEIGASGVHEFLLDTGTASTLLEPDLAAELGIAVSARTNLVTPVGARVVGVGRTRLTIGRTTLDDVEVLVTELPAIRSDEPRVRGLLGQSALSRLEYTIDHARRRLIVHRWHAGASPDTPTRPTLEARLGCGRSSSRLVLDSGVATPVLFQQGPRTPDVELRGSVHVATNAGGAVWREGRIPSLCVAGRRSGPLDVVVRPETAPARGENGLLPSRFFARVRLGRAGAVIRVDHW